MNDIETFTREAATIRGIDPDVVVRAFQTEGGVDEYAKLGDFSGPPWFSGKSWWPPQLHYGGLDPADWAPKQRDYRAWGATPGMGNGFTHLTGWEPGDPKAWRDAIRYALNRVKTGGWGPWYGPATIGITGFTGVDRAAFWDAEAEVWDFEHAVAPPSGGSYNPEFPASRQNDDWSCAPTSLDWAMRSLGRTPGDQWIETDMVRLGYVSHELGLLNHTGAGIVAWLSLMDADHYGVDGFNISTNQDPISWEQVVAEATNQAHPILLGLPNWGGPGRGHWTGVRGYDPSRGVLRLANPDSGPTYGQDTLDRAAFESRAGGDASIVRVLQNVAVTPEPAPDPIPTPDPCAPISAELERLRQGLRTLLGGA